MRVGHLTIGVRADPAGVGTRLRQALAAHIEASVAVPPNFSVRIAEQPDSFHFLYWGGRTVVRTRDAGRLLHGLLTYLSVHGDPAPGTLPVRSLALVRNGSAVLCPPGLRNSLAKIEPLLVRRGFTVLDAPWAIVDLATCELVVPEPDLVVNRSALAEIVDAAPAGRRSPPVDPGRYPIAAWLFTDPDAALDTSLSRASATVRALSILPPPTPIPPAALDGLGGLFARVPALAITKKSATALVHTIDSHAPA